MAVDIGVGGGGALRTSNQDGEHGTSLNRNSGHSGRPRTGWSQENIEMVQELLVDNPRGVSSLL